MNSDDPIRLQEELIALGALTSRRVGIGWWIDQQRHYNVPAVPLALFVKGTWAGILKNAQELSDFIKMLESRSGDDDSFMSRGFDSRTVRAVLGAYPEDSPEFKAITNLIRAAQVQAVASVFEMIDVGMVGPGGEISNIAIYELDKALEPTRCFPDLQNLFYEFLPEE